MTTTEETRVQIVNLVRDFVQRDVEPIANRYDNEDEGGVVGYDFDQCLYHYRLSLLQVLSRIVTAGGLLDFESARGRALVTALIRRSASILEDHNVIELLP